MDEFIKELSGMNLKQVEERLAKWEEEVREVKTKEELAEKQEMLKAMQERCAELKDLEERKEVAAGLAAGIIQGNTVERGGNIMNEKEERAKLFAQTGITEYRAVLATGTIAKPTMATGINDLATTAVDIVDDVNAIPLTGTGAWVVAYKESDAEASDVTDGSSVGGTGSVYKFVTINPSEWGVLDQVSNQVKKMTPVNYLDAVEKSALIALRAKASSKIVTAVKSSILAEERKGIALDHDYLKNVILGFRASKEKGGVCLYLSQADLTTLGKVRGTAEKKAIYDITFDEGTTTAGVIKEGGMATRFRVLDQLTEGEQLFGQPGAIDMPMWDNYEVKTDEGGQYFANNQIGVRGIQTAGAGLVVYHGMQIIKQAAE